MRRFAALAALAASICGANCLDDSAPPPDAAVPDQRAPDQALVAPDIAVKPDLGPPSNSGGICTGTCPASDDVCVPFWPWSSKSMCLKQCNPGTSCPVPDKVNNASYCLFQTKDANGNPMTVCGWFCEFDGKTYQCPNATDYDCKALTSTEPARKYCIPK